MRISHPPKLIVCDLDQGLLGNRDAENDLLEAWIAWENGSRPILLFHSLLSLDELSRALPLTTLPPAHFLIGAGTTMLVRYTFGQQVHSDKVPRIGFDAEHLLATIASAALSEMEAPEPQVSEFPQVRLAALTTSGLSVTFANCGKRSRRQNSSAALSWILNHPNFDSSEVRAHRPTSQARTRRHGMTAR